MDTIQEKIKYILSWIKDNAPQILPTFNPPATEKDFNQIESKLQIVLPTDFKVFYTTMNGQYTGDVFNSAIIEPDGQGPLSIEEIVEESLFLNELHNNDDYELSRKEIQHGIKLTCWNNKWIPIILDGFGNYYLMDLDPDVDGHYGQILKYNHEGPKISIMADSFDSWIADYIKYCLD